MRVEWFESLSGSRRGEWDSLSDGSSMYTGSSWLEFQDQVETGARPRYVVVRSDNGELVAGTVTYLATRLLNSYYDPYHLFPELARPEGPVLIVGNCRGYHNQLLLSHSCSTSEREHAVNLLLDAIQDQADREAGGLAWWLYVDDVTRDLLCRTYGTAPKLLDCECVISLPGNSFDDYLRSFASRRRNRIRSDINRFVRTGFAVEERSLAECIDHVVPLLVSTQRRHGESTSPEAVRRALASQMKTLGDLAVVYLCVDRGAIVGCCVTYEYGQTIYARSVGFDYSKMRGGCEYFQLVYYSPIAAGYRRAMQELNVGVDAYHAKRLRGAELMPLWALPSRQLWDRGEAAQYNVVRRQEMLRSGDGSQ